VTIASTCINGITNCQLISHTHPPQLLHPSPTLLHTFCDTPQLSYGQLGLYQLQKATGRRDIARKHSITVFWDNFRGNQLYFAVGRISECFNYHPPHPPLTHSYIEPPPTQFGVGTLNLQLTPIGHLWYVSFSNCVNGEEGTPSLYHFFRFQCSEEGFTLLVVIFWYFRAQLPFWHPSSSRFEQRKVIAQQEGLPNHNRK